MTDGDRIIIATTNSMLDCAAEKEILLTPLKLQKLLYINYGLELAGGRSIREYMGFEAWTYGPVLPMIYHKYKHLGGGLIKNKLTDGNGNVIVLVNNDPVIFTIQQYGSWKGTQLIDLLHKKNGAWWKAFSTDGSNALIDHAAIKREFEHVGQ